MLTEQEVETYKRDGLVVPQSFRLAPERLAKLGRRVGEVVAANAEIAPDRLINVHMRGAAPYRVVGDEMFSELSRDGSILDMVAQLIEPASRCAICQRRRTSAAI